jgi:hypothetical protein
MSFGPRADMTTAPKCLLHMSLASQVLVLSARRTRAANLHLLDPLHAGNEAITLHEV